MVCADRGGVCSRACRATKSVVEAVDAFRLACVGRHKFSFKDNTEVGTHTWRLQGASDTIGNPAITGNPNWTPLAVTAADPSYPGAHSTISQAAATVLSAFYGQHQRLAITLSGVTRTFGSFQAAANEAGLSRIFAGQHTRLDHQAGQLLGAQVAGFVLDHLGASLAKSG